MLIQRFADILDLAIAKAAIGHAAIANAATQDAAMEPEMQQAGDAAMEALHHWQAMPGTV